MKRHLQMARMLERKKRLKSAIAEVRKAEELDPNSVEVAVELGWYLCQVGQGQAAFAAIEGSKSSDHIRSARLVLISGWAKVQIGEFPAAEKLCSEVLSLPLFPEMTSEEIERTAHAVEAFDAAISS